MPYIGKRAKYYDGVSIETVNDPELIKHNLYGWTSEDGKRVQFYPLAFTNVESLAITIAHESVHIQQVQEEGIKNDSITMIERERAAFAFEDQ